MWKFIKKWSDVLVLLPSTLLLLIFNENWIKKIDPTAASMSAENLSVINFNIFVASAIFSLAYFIYNLFFHDYFDKTWEEKLANNPVACAIIHLVLWLSTFWTMAYLILRNI